jgi:hypothetical protein
MKGLSNEANTTTTEWYTPARYLKLVRAVLGDIELDPASTVEANKVVRAKMYYDRVSNGLSRDWRARTLFLNPPYGVGVIDPWPPKLIMHYKAGDIAEAILLVPANFETGWLKPLWDYPICFVDHRIRFYSPNNDSTSPVSRNAFVYFGSNLELFDDAFSEIGTVVERFMTNDPKTSTATATSAARAAPSGRHEMSGEDCPGRGWPPDHGRGE